MHKTFAGVFLLILVVVFGVLPGSICLAVPLSLLIFAFGIGRRSAEKEEESQGELPLGLAMAAAAMMMGALINLVWLALAAGGHR